MTIPGDYQYRALTEGRAPQRFWHGRKLELLRRLELACEAGRVLDVGCGSGVVADFLAAAGAEVDAVDPSEAAIAFARSQFHRPNLRFHLARASELDFADQQFDLIVCMELVEHLELVQARELLGTLRWLLAADGCLLITTPNSRSLWPAIEFALDLFDLTPRMRDHQHVTRFTAHRLHGLIADAGLQVVRRGRFCGLAPFVSGVCWRMAKAVDRVEWRLRQPLGNLLYAVAGHV